MARVPLLPLQCVDLAPIVLDDLLHGSLVRRTTKAVDTLALLDDPILAWSSFHAAMLHAVVRIVPELDAIAVLQHAFLGLSAPCKFISVVRVICCSANAFSYSD